jgi:hypothetical protein
MIGERAAQALLSIRYVYAYQLQTMVSIMSCVLTDVHLARILGRQRARESLFLSRELGGQV